MFFKIKACLKVFLLSIKDRSASAGGTGSPSHSKSTTQAAPKPHKDNLFVKNVCRAPTAGHDYASKVYASLPRREMFSKSMEYKQNNDFHDQEGGRPKAGAPLYVSCS